MFLEEVSQLLFIPLPTFSLKCFWPAFYSFTFRLPELLLLSVSLIWTQHFKSAFLLLSVTLLQSSTGLQPFLPEASTVDRQLLSNPNAGHFPLWLLLLICFWQAYLTSCSHLFKVHCSYGKFICSLSLLQRCWIWMYCDQNSRMLLWYRSLLPYFIQSKRSLSFSNELNLKLA